MTIRVEDNTFHQADDPGDGRLSFRRIPAGMQNRIKKAGNTFERLKPQATPAARSTS